MLLLLLLLAVLSVLLLILQAVRRLPLSAPGVVWPAVFLFPVWLGFVLVSFGDMLLQLLESGLAGLLPSLGWGLLHLFPLVLFLVIYGKLNLYPGGQDPVRRLGIYGVWIALWFQAVSAGVLAAALSASAPFLDAVIQTVGALGLSLFLLLMLCPFGIFIALPIWGGALIATVVLGTAGWICGVLCTAAAVVCVNVAVRLGRRAGRVKWFYIVLALIPAANWILLLWLLHRTKVPTA